ncbi:MAG: PC4/YdbC family ssDNA-binding protein [Bacillota bacterium]|nr:PC4/YdbC family ssDNA-binding protein [Bacillota bacterium]
MSNIEYEIIEHLGTLTEPAKGWAKEINIISWNGNDPKIDIRGWKEDHTKMTKGITLTQEEALLAAEIILNKCNY